MPRLKIRAGRYAPSFAVYLGVGGASALVEWAVFMAALEALSLHYVPASLAGFAVATFVNYLLSSRVAFLRKDRTTTQELVLVYIVSGIGLAINLGAMAILVEWVGLHALAAKVAGTGVAFVWNYGARQFYIFSREPRWNASSLQAAEPAREPWRR